MGHLFLDIETYLANDDEQTAINPYLHDSKVIVLAYNYYPGEKPPIKGEIKNPTFLKEWEMGEKNLLDEFLHTLRELKQKDPNLKIYGFNILTFDLPYLFGRMLTHKLAKEVELHDLLFSTKGTDILQMSAMLSDEHRKKEELWHIDKTDANEFHGLQVDEGTLATLSRLYDARHYDKIQEICKHEFNFEQLFNAFYLYIQRLMDGKIE